MDIRDTTLSMYVGGNGDYYLTLKETKRGNKIRLDTRIAMSGGNATREVKKAIAELYKALQGQEDSSELLANEILPLVIKSVCHYCGKSVKPVYDEELKTDICPSCHAYWQTVL